MKRYNVTKLVYYDVADHNHQRFLKDIGPQPVGNKNRSYHA